MDAEHVNPACPLPWETGVFSFPGITQKFGLSIMSSEHIENYATGAPVETDESWTRKSSGDDSSALCTAILRVLLYYDIWEYPLTLAEVQTFLPIRGISHAEISSALATDGSRIGVSEFDGYYSVRGDVRAVVGRRRARERHARWMWKAARFSTNIIKRFPFVRAVFVSGDLSKNSTGPGSDVDFFILTEPGRLWICRTLLILFKKLFLLNSKKFFCLNFFASTDNLMQQGQNIYVAAEVARLKMMYNEGLFTKFMEANEWIREYFPNYDRAMVTPDNHSTHLQRFAELLLAVLPLDRIDTFLMKEMEGIWARRYPRYDAATRLRIFRCTKKESRAYGGDFHDRVLSTYARKLREFGVGA